MTWVKRDLVVGRIVGKASGACLIRINAPCMFQGGRAAVDGDFEWPDFTMLVTGSIAESLHAAGIDTSVPHDGCQGA